MQYAILSGVPRTPWAEEALTVPIAGTVVTPDATKVEGSLLARARLEAFPVPGVGGQIRMGMVGAPTSTTGTLLFDGDIVEWSGAELDALVGTGGFVLDGTATGDAILWIVYYR